IFTIIFLLSEDSNYDTNLLDQILSTFQFLINSETGFPTPTSIPKTTYTDSEYGYKITYPVTWRFRRTYGSDISKEALFNDILSGIDLHKDTTANVGVNVLDAHEETDIEAWITQYDLNYPRNAQKKVTSHQGRKSIMYTYEDNQHTPTTSNQTLYFLSDNNAYRIFSWEYDQISEETKSIVDSFTP
ncbi:hypothetical protein JXA63_01710, partial [Candidatus Woesebacteria bacterium]|nr:hypothetical protein [Candidatus Woesebacteria bacterium]